MQSHMIKIEIVTPTLLWFYRFSERRATPANVLAAISKMSHHYRRMRSSSADCDSWDLQLARMCGDNLIFTIGAFDEMKIWV